MIGVPFASAMIGECGSWQTTVCARAKTDAASSAFRVADVADVVRGPGRLEHHGFGFRIGRSAGGESGGRERGTGLLEEGSTVHPGIKSRATIQGKGGSLAL